MSQFNTLDEVLAEWQNNYEFKKEFKKTPTAALLKANLTLSPEDLTKIKILLKIEDEELDKRINK